MSRDDTIIRFPIVVKTKNGHKIVWILLHIQAHENFYNSTWLLWYLKNCEHPVQYTTNMDKANKIARNMLKENPDVEYGIILENEHCQLNKG